MIITQQPFYVKAAAILLSLAIIITLLIVGKPVLVPLIISIYIAILFIPICNFMERIKLPRLTSAALVVITAWVILGTIIYMFTRQIFDFTSDMDVMKQKLDEYIVSVKDYVESVTGTEPMQNIDNVDEAVEEVMSNGAEGMGSSVVDVLSLLIWLIIVPILVFLLLIYRKFLREFLEKALTVHKKEDEKTFEEIIINIKQLVQSYITGMFIVMVILAAMNYAVLLAFNLENAIFFAIVAAALNVLPYLGPLIGALLASFYALLTKDNALTPLFIYASMQGIQLIEGNFLTPRIVGSKVDINPLIAILAIFVGNLIWGIAGMILIIPTVAILKLIFSQISELEPYAFLIGTVSTGDDTESKFINKQVRQLEKFVPHKRTAKKMPGAK
ncbi:MAG: AI-2E family transporter [Chitinophagales bacterium]